MKSRRNTEKGEVEGYTVNHSAVTLSQVIMPMHANPGGIFAHGGEIIKLMDTAAGLAALKHSRSQVVTLRIEGINFIQPIRVGNFVTVGHGAIIHTPEYLLEVEMNPAEFPIIQSYIEQQGGRMPRSLREAKINYPIMIRALPSPADPGK